MNNNDFTERLAKCYTGVVHDIMRDDGQRPQGGTAIVEIGSI